jgi:hypothetical protein
MKPRELRQGMAHASLVGRATEPYHGTKIEFLLLRPERWPIECRSNQDHRCISCQHRYNLSSILSSIPWVGFPAERYQIRLDSRRIASCSVK